MKRNLNTTTGLAIAAAAVVILVGCGSPDPGNQGGAGETTAKPEKTQQTDSDSGRERGSSKDSLKDGATDFQNAVADAVDKRYSQVDVTGNNSQMPTEAGQHTTVEYSTSVQGFTCDTVYMGGENVKLTKCLSPTGDPVPDPNPDPAYS